MPHLNQPIGTIIASVLNYDQLTAAIGEDKGVNNKRSSYAPCDGRSILESSLEINTRVGNNQPNPFDHIKNAPDLRGKFLRGLNQFYSPGEGENFDPKISGDPNGDNRNAGHYQTDELKAHAHNYSHMHLGFNGSNDGGLGHNEVDILPDEQRTTQPTGGLETRPRNISVYYYIKIN